MTDGNVNEETSVQTAQAQPGSGAASGSVAGDECCADWKPQIDKINGFIVLQAVRSGNPNLYDGIPIRYCPWCGKARPQNATAQTPPDSGKKDHG